jgi:murein DD-endopeptidase MepM/ murein hydrolase activator NlpD
MRRSVAFPVAGRIARIVALTALAGVAAGCSGDFSRFAHNPFSSPFAAPADPVTTGAVPAQPTLRPIAQPRPVDPAAFTAPAAASTARQPLPAPMAPPALRRSVSVPPGASSAVDPAARIAPAAQTALRPAPAAQPPARTAGWTAVGGTPFVLQRGQSLASISRGSGVPMAALLAVNGLSRAEDARAGDTLILPAYNGARVAGLTPAEAARELGAPERLAPPVRVASAEVPPAMRPIAPFSARAAQLPAAEPALAREIAAAPSAPPRPKRKAATQDAAAEAAAPRQTASRDAASAEAKPKKAVRIVPIAAAPAPERAAAERKVKTTPAPAEPQSDLANRPDVAEQDQVAAVASPAFRWPARGRVIQGFGRGDNRGIRIAVPEGTPVKAAEKGRVIYVGEDVKGYGKLVLVRHDNGFVSAYGNNSELLVKRGDEVRRGQDVARSGATGDVSSPQLHFEIRNGAEAVDPAKFLGD